MESLKRKKVVIWFTIVGVVIIAALPTYLFLWLLKDTVENKIIDYKFHNDIKQYPTVKINSFQTWESDSIVSLSIPKKGKVNFWYGMDGVPRIQSIGNYVTSFDCYTVAADNTKRQYAYTTNLWLDSTSPFKKWFPFQVSSLGDLIQHYSDIERVLDTFPRSPTLITFHDARSDRQIVKQPNPNFQLTLNRDDKPQVCDLYL